MAEFFEKALSVIPANPISLVGFVALLIAYVLLSLRTVRNKQILAKIKDLPEKDRLRVLESEMGVLKLEGGMTAEQYLQGQRDKYILFGVLAFFALIVLLVSIVTFTPDPPLPTPPTPTPITGQIKNVEFLHSVTLATFLRRHDVPTNSPLFEEITKSGAADILGIQIYNTLVVEGLQNRVCQLKWSMLEAQTRKLVSEEELSYRVDLQELRFTYTPTLSPDNREGDLWIPYPRRSGTFIVRTELFYDNIRLVSRESTPFPVEFGPGITPVATSTATSTATPPPVRTVDPRITPVATGAIPTATSTTQPIAEASATPSASARVTPVATPIRVKPVFVYPGGEQFEIPTSFYETPEKVP